MKKEYYEVLKEILQVGDWFACWTVFYENGKKYTEEYNGYVEEIHDTFLVLDDGMVDFNDIYAHSHERDVRLAYNKKYAL